MKRVCIHLLLLSIVLLFAIPAHAQATTHSVALTWADTLNPATGTTYSVYRATGLCSGTPVFSKIASAIAVKTYTDTTVTPGNYCYAVSATVGGMESPLSSSVLAPVPAFSPTALTETVQ